MAPQKSRDSDNEDDDVVTVSKYYEIDESKGERVVAIKELDIHSINPKNKDDVKSGSRYAVIGMPGSGKSSLIEYIAYFKRHILAVGQVYSGSEENQPFFSKFMPQSFINGDVDAANMTPLENFEKRQKFARQFLEPEGMNPWCLNVVEDSTADIKYMKTPVFQRMYKNGRHWRMLHLLSLQFALDLKTNIRGCLDGVFIMFTANPDIRKKIFEKFGNYIPSFSDFCDLMDSLKQYEALFINYKSSDSNELEDNVFFIKPDMNRIPKGWKLGCAEYWDFHNERFNPSHSM